ncbi:MAG: class I SAM-dependent methyltransferase [Nannocystaceae bacterium]
MPAPTPREFVCPLCLGELAPSPDGGLGCPACAREAARWDPGDGVLDFIGEREPEVRGVGPKLMHSPILARLYQRFWRPVFTAVAGGRPHDLAEELALVDRALAPAEGGLVLDLSCGPGHAARHFAGGGRFGAVHGVDWSLAMLRQCRALCRDDGIDDVLLVRADVARLPYRSGSVAGVHAGAALHLWPDPAAAAAEIARVLRPGGAFIASTFAHRRGRVFQAIEGAFQTISTSRVFHEEELVGLFAAHGLVDAEVMRRGSLILLWGRRAGAPAAAAAPSPA